MPAVRPNRIEMIPISQITILNPRARNKRQHREIVNNIEAIGLKRPITVSRRDGAGGPICDLVCGEGRLRQMSAVRQIEAADLMIGQNNFSIMFARAIRAATPESLLIVVKKGKRAGTSAPSGQQIARMERELSALQTQVKSIDETYGIDNLHLTVARGYIAKLLTNQPHR